MIEIQTLKQLALKYSHSLDCLALIADLNRSQREEGEANETLKRLQSQVNALKQALSA